MTDAPAMLLAPRPDNTTDFNPMHWAYAWGVEVKAGTSLAPGSPGVIPLDHPRFTPRARWHFNAAMGEATREKAEAA